MIRPATPAGMQPVRGLGWDIDTSYSANRGELLPIGSFGHTGFTGTSIWIDPLTRTFVILLTNRVHPAGKGDATPLRARLASVVASAITDAVVPPHMAVTGTDFGAGPSPSRPPLPVPVQTGIDVLRAEGFARLKGRRVGLVTNHTGRAADGTPTIDLLVGAAGPHARRAVQPGARHSRHRRRGRPVVEGREDGPGHPLALRRDAASDRRDA